MTWPVYIAVAVVAYLLGSIPTGYLVARASGIDIQSVGSGNIGATNVLRVLGKRAGIFVLVMDGLKGFLACAVLSNIAFGLAGGDAGAGPSLRSLAIVAGLFAIVGHNYTIWLRFRGGKGIATSAGVLVSLVPGALAIITGIWILVVAITRYVSLASVLAAFTLPFAVWVTIGSTTMILISAGIAVLAIYKHRANIQRLLAGTESRFNLRRRSGTS